MVLIGHQVCHDGLQLVRVFLLNDADDRIHVVEATWTRG